ncbi:MAG: alpha/beta fold hydrolase [Dehalococcoidia bacterium]
MADRFPNELPIQFTTTSDGVRIAYAVVGQGPTCVFTQAPACAHSQLGWSLFRDNFVLLAERLRLVLFDWRNTGMSGATEEGFTIEAGVRDLDAVVDSAAPGEPISLWASAGSAFAVVPYAARHPDRVQRLALFCPGVRPASNLPRSWLAWQDLIDEEPEFATKLSLQAGAGWENEVEARKMQYLAAGAPLDYQARIENLVATKLDVTEYIPHVTCPTLVVGRRELWWPTASDCIELAAEFPDGRFVLLDGASYFPGDDEPAGPVMVEFLAGVPPAAAPVAEPRSSPCEPLSVREHEVLALIAGGKTNPEIAEALTIAPATASRHVHNILGKIGATRRSEAAAYALREGLVE